MKSLRTYLRDTGQYALYWTIATLALGRADGGRPVVCVTHRRLVPCRVTPGRHRYSAHRGTVAQVRRSLREGVTP